MKTVLLILLCYCMAPDLYGQNAVRIHFHKMGKDRSMEIYPGDRMEYKLPSDLFWKKDIVVALNDSLLIFRSGTEVPFSSIKCIKVHAENHLTSAFTGFFAGLSVMFISLDTFNNIILQRSTVVNPKAVVVSAALAGASALVYRAGYRKVKMNRRIAIVNITTNYRNMAPVK